MNRRLRTRFFTLALGLSLLPLAARAADRQGNFTEEFHQTYALSAQGRIKLENVNGPVHISAWDRNEVKVDAVKRAGSKERLDEVKIQVDASKDDLAIRTEYPSHDRTFWNDDRHDNPASVEYTLTVPRRANLDEIKLVNGALDVQDVAGEVRASCVNGRIQARNLQGRTHLNTVNGELEASMDRLPSLPVELSSVNGTLRVTLPSDSRAVLEASTISGNISDDFGLPVSRHQFVGRSMHAELGRGGTRVKLSSVNGRIEIRRANDNRPLSPVKNLDRDHGDEI